MNPHRKPVYLLASGLAAFLFVIALAACDTPPSATVDDEVTATELDQLTTTLATELQLSTEQTNRINGLGSGHDQPEPGPLWAVAAALQQTLTDEQKADLFDKVEQRRARVEEGGRRRSRFNREADGPARRMQQGDARQKGFAEALTDEQQEQLKAQREANRTQMKALVEARRAGSLSPEDFRAQAQALRAEMHEAVENVLTDEQKAELEQKRDARKAPLSERQAAAEQAKADALGLTGAQEAALQALGEEQHAERRARMGQIRSGHENREAVREAIHALRETHKAALAEILTSEQLEIVAIRDALLGGVLFARRGARPGFRGARGVDGPRGFRGQDG